MPDIASTIDDDPIASTVQWALERLGDPFTVGELARRSHLSPRQFSRRFRAATGTSPGGWLLRQRLQASLTLLERSDASIEEIELLVGLPSAGGFRRHFCDAFGVSPSSSGATSSQCTAPDPRLQRPPPIELSLPHGRRTCRSPLATRSERTRLDRLRAGIGTAASPGRSGSAAWRSPSGRSMWCRDSHARAGAG
jgi:AraC-like DNA-binding protein